MSEQKPQFIHQDTTANPRIGDPCGPVQTYSETEKAVAALKYQLDRLEAKLDSCMIGIKMILDGRDD